MKNVPKRRNKTLFGLTLLGLGLQLLSLQAWGDDFWTSISIQPQGPLITQREVSGGMACVPTSILYMLKLGNSKLQTIYQSLPGENDSEKLASIVQEGLSLPSTAEAENRRTVFNQEFGSHMLDRQKWIEHLALQTGSPIPKLSYRVVHRPLDEKVAGRFVRRIHSMILNSIQKGYPVIFGIEIRSTDFDDGLSGNFFSHASALVDVQSRIPDGDLGFMVQFFDPNTGRKTSAMIYEEINIPFNARIWDRNLPSNSEWSEGRYGVFNFDNEFVSSPYLKIAAPTLIPYASFSWQEKIDAFVTSLTLYTSH